MPISPTFTWEFDSSCSPIYFEDDTCTYNATTCPSGYGSPNIGRLDVTSTKIVVADSNGNEWEYTDYLPTDGEVELTYANFTQTEEAETVLTDTGCGCTAEDTTPTSFSDGCYSISYYIYTGDLVQAGVATDFQFFYCTTRNRIFDLIIDSCSDCCDQEKQNKIWEVRQQYEDMLTVYNKLQNCGCAEGTLVQIDKKLDKLEGDCE
jgi:hypothetical protein